MRVLMISDVYFPRINGVSTSIQTFRRELQQLGHEITLIAPEYGRPSDTEDGILRVASRGILFDPEDRLMRAGSIRRHEDRLRRQAFDLLHIQTPFTAHYSGLRLARRLGIPCVESYHTFFEEYLYHYVPFAPKPLFRFIARVFSRRQCNAVDALVVPSSAMQNVLWRYGITVPTEVIPTGIDLEGFREGHGERFRTRHGIGPRRPTLVHVGRVAHEKNIGFLLKVLDAVRKRIPDVLLIIAGEGPALAGLRRQTEVLGLTQNVQFVGYLSRQGELQDCYAAGDAFVFASPTETQGLVLLEAMALGIPVVSTAVMGTRDILAPRLGALVAREDVAEFSAQVVRILADRELRARLALEAREYAREWTAERLAEKMAAFYQRMIEEYAQTRSASSAPSVPTPLKGGRSV